MINTIYKRGRIYWFKYRAQGETGAPVCLSLGTSDKQSAERLRMDKLAEFERERAGILAPKALRDGAHKLLTEHLQDLLADLEKQGQSEKYLANIDHRVGVLIQQCGWRTAKDVTADSFQTWRKGIQLSAKTLNDYLEAVRRLFTWMEKQGRVAMNPLRVVEKVATAGRQTRVRRAFSEQELRQLLAVVPADRFAVYLTAVNTGLRRRELTLLRWGDLHLDAVQPFVYTRALTTKNKKRDLIRLRDEVVAALLKIRLNDAGDADNVFPRFPRIERFRRDLVKAGVQYKNEHGYADFHSLRNTFCTNLGNAGVQPAIRQALMRHSDSKLTERIYTDTHMLATWAAVEKLPDLTETLYQGVSQKLVANGHDATLAGGLGNGVNMQQTPVNIEESHAVALAVMNGHEVPIGGSDGARTRNLCRDRAAL